MSIAAAGLTLALVACGDSSPKPTPKPDYDFSTLKSSADSFQTACRKGDQRAMDQALAARQKYQNYAGGWYCSYGNASIVTTKSAGGLPTLREQSREFAQNKCRAGVRGQTQHCLAESEISYLLDNFNEFNIPPDGLKQVVSVRDDIIREYPGVYRFSPTYWKHNEPFQGPYKIGQMIPMNSIAQSAANKAAEICRSSDVPTSDCMYEKAANIVRQQFKKEACDGGQSATPFIEARRQILVNYGPENVGDSWWQCPPTR